MSTVLRLTLALFLAVLFSADGNAAYAAESTCGLEKAALNRTTFATQTPSDFYELCIDNDPPVCADIAARINHFLEPEQREEYPRFRDSVLRNYIGHTIPYGGWAPAYYSREEIPPELSSQVTGGWNRLLAYRAVVDLNHDGANEVLYQWQTGLGGFEFLSVLLSDLPGDGAHHFEMGVMLETDVHPSHTDPNVMVGQLVIPEAVQQYIGVAGHDAWLAYSDITEVRGRIYYVVMHPPMEKNFPIAEVFILAMEDADSGRLVCKFEARYQLVPDEQFP